MKNLTKSEKLAWVVGFLYLVGGIRREMDWLGILTTGMVLLMFVVLIMDMRGRK